MAVGEPGRLARIASPVGVAVLAAAGAVALHVRDPHRSGSWGFCPTALIGLDCPLCGSLRGVHHLTNLDLGSAASSNLLLVLGLPVVLVLWARRVGVAWRGGPAWRDPLAAPTWLWWAVGACVAVFTVLRNLPAGGWLAS